VDEKPTKNNYKPELATVLVFYAKKSTTKCGAFIIF